MLHKNKTTIAARERLVRLMAGAMKPATLVAMICDLEDDGYSEDDAANELVAQAQGLFCEQLHTLVGEAEAQRMIESYDAQAVASRRNAISPAGRVVIEQR